MQESIIPGIYMRAVVIRRPARAIFTLIEDDSNVPSAEPYVMFRASYVFAWQKNRILTFCPLNL
jgi:hypothetical protein